MCISKLIKKTGLYYGRNLNNFILDLTSYITNGEELNCYMPLVMSLYSHDLPIKSHSTWFLDDRISTCFSLIFKPGARRPQAGTRLVSRNHFDADVGMCVYVCVCVSVCPPPRLLETSGVICGVM